MGLFDRLRPSPPGLLCLADVLHALGEVGGRGTLAAGVPVAAIVGTDARWHDFDASFVPCRARLRARLRDVERAMSAGRTLPPVRLVRVGDLYFVVDGHHRVAAARRLHRPTLDARVHRIETVAWGQRCLRARHLATKSGECRFLERVPVPEPDRCRQWLDDPADWARLTLMAEAWGTRHLTDGQHPDSRDLARAWWRLEVLPVVGRWRSAAIEDERTDVQVYLDARDREACARTGGSTDRGQAGGATAR